MALLTCCQARFVLPDSTSQRAQELLKEGPRIVGAGRCLRMVLNAEGRQVPVSEPLDSAVIQIHMGDLEVGGALNRSLVPLNREAVILGRNEHPTRLDLFN